jgi:hypothetical protein
MVMQPPGLRQQTAPERACATGVTLYSALMPRSPDYLKNLTAASSMTAWPIWIMQNFFIVMASLKAMS